MSLYDAYIALGVIPPTALQQCTDKANDYQALVLQTIHAQQLVTVAEACQ